MAAPQGRLFFYVNIERNEKMFVYVEVHVTPPAFLLKAICYYLFSECLFRTGKKIDGYV
jgi:hypothetical protein